MVEIAREEFQMKLKKKNNTESSHDLDVWDTILQSNDELGSTMLFRAPELQSTPKRSKPDIINESEAFVVVSEGSLYDDNLTQLSDTSLDKFLMTQTVPADSTYISASPHRLESVSGRDMPFNILQESNSFVHDSFHGAENQGHSNEDSETIPEQSSIHMVDDQAVNDQAVNDQVRKRSIGKENWKREIKKQRRSRGEKYEGRKYEKDSKTFTIVVKPEKVLKEACKCQAKGTECQLLSEEDRSNIFRKVWEMTWEQKETFVLSLISKRSVDRKTVEASHRTVTLTYRLQADSKIVPVCKKMFLDTTGLTEHFIRSRVLAKMKENESRSSSQMSAGPDSAGRKQIRSFLESLPTVPSHYCRKTSSKRYLEPIFGSYLQLYNFYCDDCKANDKVTMSRQVFMDELHSAKIDIFQPRKDQCDICVSHKEGNVTDEIFEIHRKKKERAQTEKSNDKIAAKSSEGKTKMITIDLQAVLLAPNLKASALYYRTKLCVHNFTIYDCTTKQVRCYVWHESEGGLTSNEFATCLIDYLEDNLSFEEFVIFSDGCSYQNRNANLSKALSYFSQTHDKTVVQKILEKGHTQMEVDSVHSTIERHLKNKSVYCPAEYVSYIQQSRTNPEPYEVKYLTHEFFMNYSEVSTLKSIRPSSRVGGPHVTDIRGLKYTQNGEIFFKFDFDQEWTLLENKRGESSVLMSEPVRLHTERRKINKAKYKHLQELKEFIPRDFHSFYDSLPC